MTFVAGERRVRRDGLDPRDASVATAAGLRCLGGSRVVRVVAADATLALVVLPAVDLRKTVGSRRDVAMATEAELAVAVLGRKGALVGLVGDVHEGGAVAVLAADGAVLRLELGVVFIGVALAASGHARVMHRLGHLADDLGFLVRSCREQRRRQHDEAQQEHACHDNENHSSEANHLLRKLHDATPIPHTSSRHMRPSGRSRTPTLWKRRDARFGHSDLSRSWYPPRPIATVPVATCTVASRLLEHTHVGAL